MGTGTIAGAAGNNAQLRGQLSSLNRRLAALESQGSNLTTPPVYRQVYREVQPGLTDMCIRVNSQ